jgi:hypothetical protein
VADISVGRDPAGLYVFVNPEFAEREGMQLEEEGCLSVPGFKPPWRVGAGDDKGLDRNGVSTRCAARSSWPGASSTRWTTSTGSSSSIGSAVSRDFIVRKIRSSIAPENGSEPAGLPPSEVEGLRVVFFGTPRFAVPTLEALLGSRHDVVGVVTQPDRPRGRGQKVTEAPVKAAAAARALPIIQPASLRAPGVDADLPAWRPDLGVVAAYGQLIPTPLLSVPRLGMINVHRRCCRSIAARLGPSRGDRRRDGNRRHHHARRAEARRGAMFATTVRPIGRDETSDVVRRAGRLGGRLLVEVATPWPRAPRTGTQDERPPPMRRGDEGRGLID